VSTTILDAYGNNAVGKSRHAVALHGVLRLCAFSGFKISIVEILSVTIFYTIDVWKPPKPSKPQA
jgi:hypothetical protein